MSDPTPLRPVQTDPHSAHELHAAIVMARHRLLDVLHARARTLGSIGTWSGPHRDRYDQDAEELLAAGRALDASLGELLTALEADLDGHAAP